MSYKPMSCKDEQAHGGRRKLAPDAESGMPAWQGRLFIAMANAAIDPSDYFRLPTNRVVEPGAHVII